MPDHLHLLVRLAPTDATLGEIIGAFKRFTTRQSWKLGYEGALWQSRYYDHILRRSEHGEKVARYILANPVRKGLVETGGEYPYSGCLDPM
jgi:REP element-mobilizing transposase RayT